MESGSEIRKKGDQNKPKSLLDSAEFRQNPFTVPDQYFEGLQQKLEDRVNQQDIEIPRQNRLVKSKPWLLPLAAVFTLGLAGIVIMLVLESRTTPPVRKASPQLVALETLTKQSAGTRPDSFPKDSTSAGNTKVYQPGVTTFNLEDVPDEDIINYLMDEDFDITELSE